MALIIFAGCGKNDPQSEAKVAPAKYDSLSPEQRAHYCVMAVDSEDEPLRNQLLNQIKGTWTHIPTDPQAGFRKREFLLDLGNPHAAVTIYEDMGKEVHTILFKKICLSQPLDPSYGAFAGYRVLEFLASDNDGGAALLVQLDQGVFTASNAYYTHSATGKLMPVADLLKTSEASALWVYREHKN